jgi:hypothetical protein
MRASGQDPAFGEGVCESSSGLTAPLVPGEEEPIRVVSDLVVALKTGDVRESRRNHVVVGETMWFAGR